MDALSQTNVVDFSASLAADLAAGLYDHETVFKNHGMSVEAGNNLLAQDWFRKMVDQAKQDWDALDNVKDRIKIKAQIALEESIPIIYNLLSDNTTPGAARVAAFKEIKEIAGMGAKDYEGATPSFIPVQIFLDGREKPAITISGYPGVREEPEELEDETDEAEVIVGTFGMLALE